MKISLRDGFYCVYHFVSEHSHNVATRSQVHRLRPHRKINEAHISTKGAIDLMAKQACGSENLGFTRVDMKNRLYSKTSLKTKKSIRRCEFFLFYSN